MTKKTQGNFSERLYQSLPAFYREKDSKGDLQHYLNACGRLLDSVYATIEQRLADSFPDNPESGEGDDTRACQSWVLPYFADLLDADLYSPDVEGRRDEISHAVVWRQSKGTAPCVESISEAVGQMEVEMQEGWQRTAVTPRVNKPLMPPRAYGYEEGLDLTIPRMAARHPGLPVAMVDLRCYSGAVSAPPRSPGSKESNFDGDVESWRQASPYALPAHPGSYDDVSRRTVDVRAPAWNQGHAHPKQLLLYVPPPDGFYSSQSVGVYWNKKHVTGSNFQKYIEEIPPNEDDAYPVHIFRNRSFGKEDFQAVHIKGKVTLTEDIRYRFEGLQFEHTLLSFANCVELEACAVFKLKSRRRLLSRPVIKAKDCLINTLHCARGKANLEYCTVLGESVVEYLNASDCILMEPVYKDFDNSKGGPIKGCFRYSRYHPDQELSRHKVPSNPLSELIQVVQTYACTSVEVAMFNEDFGVSELGRSAGVLHPACSEKVLHGAEDGGEMGAFHHKRYSLQFSAIKQKLNNFIPIGMEVAVIPDTHLWDKPK